MADPDPDYDADLMKVAGLDKSSKGKPSKGQKRRRPVPDSDSSSDELEVGETATPVGQKRRPANTGKAEGTGKETFPDGYGADLMGDQADREKLASMDMLTREMEIFERSEARREMMDALAAERKLHGNQAQDDKAANNRASTRAKTAKATPSSKAKSNALAELNAARSAKQRRTARQQAHSSSEDELSEESYRDSGDESARSESAAAVPDDKDVDDEDMDDAAPTLSAQPEFEGLAARDDEEDIDFRQALSIQLKRDQLQKWVHEPFFSDTVRDCLVRARSGTKYVVAKVQETAVLDPGTAKGPENRVFRVPYKLEKPFHKVETRVALIAERGSLPATLPLILLSNSPIEREEWDEYVRTCRKDRVQITSVSEAQQVASQIKAAQTYVYTTQDVQRMVQEKRARGQAANAAMHKAHLQQQLQHARDTDNEQLAVEMQQQLTALEDKEEARVEAPGPKKNDMGKINSRNARHNFENALHNVSARPGAVAGQGADEVFARRSTRPMNYWATGKKGEQQTNASDAEAGEDAEPDTPAAPKASAVQDADGHWKLRIDLSRIVIPTREQKLAWSILGRNWQPKTGLVDVKGKTMLTLSDYQQRQGL